MRALTWPFLSRWADVGHLVVRAGVGAMMITHGWPKVQGGEAAWRRVGSAMATFGVHFAPTLWGAAAAFTEAVGGALLVVGLATRPASALLAFTMFVAASTHLHRGQGLGEASHAIELCLVFLGLVLMGGGRFSLDRSLGG